MRGEGLDEQEYIFVQHKDKNEMYKLPLEVINLSGYLKAVVESDSSVIDNPDKPIVISEGDDDSFAFIIFYIQNVMKHEQESKAMDFPLPYNINIKKYFDDDPVDSGIFDIFIASDTLGEKGIYDQYFPILFSTIRLADYLEMEQLERKIASIIGYYIRFRGVKQFLEK